jgi:hypothetical protein
MRSLSSLAVALIATALTACAARPTEVTTTWRDPVTTPIQFRRVLAIFVGGDTAMRRKIENRVARNVSNTVASNTVIPDAELADTVGVRSRIAEGGYDGVVVLRLTSVGMRAGGETIPTLGDPSETLAEYLRRSPRSALASGQETVITMESRLYSVRDGKLIWAGTSGSFSPLSIGELVDQLVDASIQELRDQRLL